jgi:hypothetical protein
MILKHKHIEGLSIELLNQTNRGWKVLQTELFTPWTGKKLRKPKTATKYYSQAEIADLFTSNQ